MSKIAFGTSCLWWDDARQATTLVLGQQAVCPGCGGPVRKVAKGRWDQALVDNHVDVNFLNWCRGQCFTNAIAAMLTYKIRKGMGL